MANQWGTGATEGDERPNWFKDTTTVLLPVTDATTANTVIYDRPNHPADAELLEATERGWERVVRYGSPERVKREVVVANGELGTTLTNPVIADVRWAVAHDSAAWTTSSKASVVVTFSHPVIVAGTPASMTVSVVSSGTNFTCEYASGNKTNKLTFTDGANIPDAGTLTLVANFLTLNSGTIHAYNPATDASTGVTATITSLIAIGTDAGVRVVA